MGTVLLILVLAGGLAACVAAFVALRSYLGFRRTRITLQTGLLAEVAQLAGRATELEMRLAALDAHANALPIRVHELQQDLATLRVLTNALAVSLGQAHRVLSPAGLKTSLATPLVALSRNLRGERR